MQQHSGLVFKGKNVQEVDYIVSKHRNQIPDGAAFHPRKTDNLSETYGCWGNIDFYCENLYDC